MGAFDASESDISIALGLEAHLHLFCQRISDSEADVMARLIIFGTDIPEADDEVLHCEVY